jgi:hypothetical protein
LLLPRLYMEPESERRTLTNLYHLPSTFSIIQITILITILLSITMQPQPRHHKMFKC